MKKINLLILTLLFVLPLAVKAAGEPKVLTIEATSKNTTIEYKGTTEEGCHAVMCKLYNSKEEEIDLLSSAVDTKKFNGSFTVKEKGDYKVTCANYDGGEIKEANVTVKENAKGKDNPGTYDSGIMVYIVLVIVCIAGIVGVLVYKNKKKDI